MSRTLLLLVALTLPGAVVAAEKYTFRLPFPDQTPGVLHARVDKVGDRHIVTCEYLVSQEEEMDLADMPLGSWHGTGIEKADRDSVRALCLEHYEDALPRD